MNLWLEGYTNESRIIAHIRKTRNWAGGKGKIKKLISSLIQYESTSHPSKFTAGQIDAILDSVGC